MYAVNDRNGGAGGSCWAMKSHRVEGVSRGCFTLHGLDSTSTAKVATRPLQRGTWRRWRLHGQPTERDLIGGRQGYLVLSALFVFTSRDTGNPRSHGKTAGWTVAALRAGCTGNGLLNDPLMADIFKMSNMNVAEHPVMGTDRYGWR